MINISMFSILSQLLTFLLTTLTICPCAFTKNLNKDGNFELLILHSNDIHATYEETSRGGGDCIPMDKKNNACYGGIARIAHVVKEAKRRANASQGPPVLHLNAGDTYSGSIWHHLFHGEAASNFINAIDVDAMSLGNHEFDDGTSQLTDFIKNITKSTPVLCANLVLTEEPELASANIENSIVLHIKGHKVGIIGYLTPNTRNTISIKNKVDYIDEIIAIKAEVQKLRENGVNILIALGHSGYPRDLEIAKEVDGLDLVIGGHSHTLLCNNKCPDPTDIVNKNETYPTIVTQASGRIVRVVQAKCNTKYLGQITLTFDSSGEIINAFGQPLLLDATVPQDSTVLSIVENYHRLPQLLEWKKVVGRTSVSLSNNNCKKGECNIGNLITDAMVYYYANNYQGEHWTDAPIAIIQLGGIRASIEHSSLPTDITMIDLFTVMPFENKLWTVMMNGTVLLTMLEHCVAKYETDPRGFLQVSGLRVVYNVSKPAGSRVVKVEARCSTCKVPEYFEVEERGVYKVISQGFIAKGGDGFEMLGQSHRTSLDYTELLCTKYFIGNKTLVFPEIEGRITVLS